MAIHLGRLSPGASRDLPGRRRENPSAGEPTAAPIWSCSRWGLPCHRRYRRRGALLPHPFTLASRPKRGGGLLSVALSLGSPPPGVTRHRVSVEPGLSSPRCRQSAPEGGHPAIWQLLGKTGNRRRQAPRRIVKRQGGSRPRDGAPSRGRWRRRSSRAGSGAGTRPPLRGSGYRGCRPSRRHSRRRRAGAGSRR